MKGTDDVVAVSLTHRHSGVAHFHQLVNVFLWRILDIDHEHIGTRRHDLVSQLIVKLEDTANHSLSFFHEGAVLLPYLKYGYDLVLGILLLTDVSLLSKQFKEDIGNEHHRARKGD